MGCRSIQRAILIVVVALTLAPFCFGLDRNAALAFLSQRVDDHRSAFFVYQDADSGMNHGFASGYFGSIAKIDLDSACVDDPSAGNGCTANPARLDRTRGNVLRISFAPMTSNEFAGVNVEEPENWGAQNRGVGYDLRGATALVLDVRSPSPFGIRVQFGVDGKTTDFIQIPQSASFSTMTIPLASLHPRPPDLANVHILFAVVTNGSNAQTGGTLLMDNVRFTPVPTSHQISLGFPLATQTFGVLPTSIQLDGRVPIPPDQVNRNVTTIYESCLTLQALLDRGTVDDRSRAAIIADTFVYALAHDNHGLVLPAAPDGSMGLHSGYEGGDVALLNDQAPGGGQAGDVRLAGFTAGAQQCGPSRYCPVLDDATGGNASFAILALIDAYTQLGDTKYLDSARTIGNWIYANLRDPSSIGFGGYLLGYPGQAQAKKDPLGAKVVENNADIFAAFSQLAEMEGSRPSGVSAAEWTRRANIAGDFIMQMFDATTGRFLTGTITKGTPPSDGIVPGTTTKGNDTVNVFDFLDANTFAVLALAESPRYRTAIDWRRPVQWIAAQAVTVTTGGKTYKGQSLVAKPSGGPNGIAWELTGQTVAAMRLVDCLYGETRFASAADGLVDQIGQTQTSAPFSDGQGVVAATMQDGDILPPREQCLSTPFQCIPERLGLAATAWGLFADGSLNPLSSTGTLKICGARPRRRAAGSGL